MKEGWENLCEVKKLLKEWRKRKAEPGIELLLTKNSGIEWLFFGWHRANIHKVDSNPCGMWKHSLNSFSERSSIGFFEEVGHHLLLADHLYRPYQPCWWKPYPLALTCWSNGPSKTCMTQRPVIRKQSPGPSAKRQCLRCATVSQHRPKTHTQVEPLAQPVGQALTKVLPLNHTPQGSWTK